MVDTTFFDLAIKSISGIFRVEVNQVESTQLTQADKLAQILKQHLEKHIREKVNDETKHHHPVLLFVWSNLNQFTAILSLSKQARTILVMKSDRCLLEHPSRGGFLSATDRSL